ASLPRSHSVHSSPKGTPVFARNRPACVSRYCPPEWNARLRSGVSLCGKARTGWRAWRLQVVTRARLDCSCSVPGPASRAAWANTSAPGAGAAPPPPPRALERSPPPRPRPVFLLPAQSPFLALPPPPPRLVGLIGVGVPLPLVGAAPPPLGEDAG